MQFIFAIPLMLLAAAVHSASITLDFDNIDLEPPAAGGPSNSVAAPFTTQGYTLSAVGGADDYFVYGSPAGVTDGLALSYCPSCSLTIERADLSSFELASFDYMPGGSLPDSELTIIGQLATGGSVQTTFFGLTDFIYSSFTLGPEWTGLDSVTFSFNGQPAFGSWIDNVTLTAVPIPAAVWLFGSGLGILGWFRRR